MLAPRNRFASDGMRQVEDDSWWLSDRVFGRTFLTRVRRQTANARIHKFAQYLLRRFSACALRRALQQTRRSAPRKRCESTKGGQRAQVLARLLHACGCEPRSSKCGGTSFRGGLFRDMERRLVGRDWSSRALVHFGECRISLVFGIQRSANRAGQSVKPRRTSSSPRMQAVAGVETN